MPAPGANIRPESTRISVGQHLALLLEGDFSRGLAAFAEDVVWHVPSGGALAGEHRGREAVLALVERLFRARQSRAPMAFRVLTDRDGYLVEWLELGSAPSSAPIACPLVSRTRAGQIVEVWLCGGANMLGLGL